MVCMQYKRFQGTVEFNDADGVFHGKIRNIDGLVTYEADTKCDLVNAFRDAVEDYLEDMA